MLYEVITQLAERRDPLFGHPIGGLPGRNPVPLRNFENPPDIVIDRARHSYGAFVIPAFEFDGYVHQAAGRITSYNVCYTKLLRLQPATAGKRESQWR